MKKFNVAFILIGVSLTVSCTQTREKKTPTDATAPSAKMMENTLPKSIPPAYQGQWRLDVDAYERSTAFNALGKARQQAVRRMLRRAKSELVISAHSIQKTGQFGTKTTTTSSRYTVERKSGDVWMVQVMENGIKESQEWRMSGEHLVIRVDGKDRIFQPIKPVDSSPPDAGTTPKP